MAAHQAPLSRRFSRQEHWSGLPFPSPMHEREKWKWSHSVIATRWTAAYQAPLPIGFSRQEYWGGLPLPSPSRSVVSNSLWPPGSSVHGFLQARILKWVASPSSKGSCQPRDWTQFSHTAGRFFTIWATREASLRGNSLILKMGNF